ncbi:phage tail protein [Streptomyces sp. NPDC015131]|uniref:phage tail protein n=1 Tax=Streptomyces sp. NPDC015131 TaxID=3364941 RepID=UPI0036FAC280
MRAGVPGLGSPYSLADLLPEVYREDPFTVRLTAGWDEVVAPVIGTLDCLDAYLDPRLAPEDLLVWLAERLGARLDEKWPVARKRAATGAALTGHRTRGTVAGVCEEVALATGCEVELADSGGVFTSRTPDAPFPEDLPDTVVVRVVARDSGNNGDGGGTEAGAADVEALVGRCLPAHVPYRAEVVHR